MPEDQARVTSPPAGGAFGPNAWLVDDMFEAYRSDPSSVSESWREFFADYVPGGVAAPSVAPTPPARALEPTSAGPAPRPPPPLPLRPPPPHPPGTRRAHRHRRPPDRRAVTDGRHRRHRRGAGHRGRAGGGTAAGRPGAHRAEHGRLVVGPHGHERALGPGQAARGQPGHAQPAPGPHLGGEGQLHASDRLRRGAGARGGPRPQLQLRARRGRHGQAGRGPPRPRRPGPRRGPREVRRHAHTAGPGDQRGRGPRLPGIRDRLRGHGAQGPHRQGRAGRLRRCDGHPHQPRNARHGAVGAEADAGPGRHHRRGRARVPGRVSGRRPPQPGGDRRRARGHADVHLRPPHHPGGGVRAVPHLRDRVPHRGPRLLRVGVRGHGRALPTGALAGRRQCRRRRAPAPREAGPRPEPDQHVPGAWASHRRSRPAVGRAPAAAPRARPHHLRPDAVGPRP